MSTEIANLKGGALSGVNSALLERLAAQAKDAAAKERPALGKITLPSGILTYNGVSQPGNKMEVLILAATYRNTWYRGPYDPDNVRNPGCFALALEESALVPDSIVPTPPKSIVTGEPTTNCKDCAYGQWKSDPDPKRKGKACKQSRRLVLLPANLTKTADEVTAGELAVMDMPVTSAVNYGNFVNSVTAMTGMPSWMAHCEISIERDPKTQFKVLLKPFKLVDSEPIIMALEKKKEEATRIALMPYDDVDTSDDDQDAAEAAAPPPSGKKAKF